MKRWDVIPTKGKKPSPENMIYDILWTGSIWEWGSTGNKAEDGGRIA